MDKLDIRKEKLLVYIILFSTVCIYFIFLDPIPIIAPDASVFLNLALSLLNGSGYANIWLLDVKPHIKFPFFFPVMLMPILSFFKVNFLILKTAIALMGISAFFLTHNFFKKQGKLLSISILFLCGMSAYIFVYAHTIMSEIPYLFFSLLTLSFGSIYIEVNDWKHWSGLATGICLLAAYFTRTIGIILILALIITLILNKKSNRFAKVLFILGFISMPVLVWTLRSHYIACDIPGDYLKSFFTDRSFQPVTFTQLLVSGVGNIYAYVFYAVPEVITGIRFLSRSFIALIISALVFWGFLVRMRSVKSMLEWYVFWFMLVLFFWPWSKITGQRFIVPLIPFLFYYFYAGAERVISYFPKKKNMLMLIMLILLASTNIFSPLRYRQEEYQQLPVNRSEVNNIIELSFWLKNHTNENDILLSFGAESSLYLLSRRKSAGIREEPTLRELLTQIYVKKIDFVVFNIVFGRSLLGDRYPELKSFFDGHKESFTLKYGNRDNNVYKVNRSGLEQYLKGAYGKT